MNWIDVAWPAMGSGSITLALVHLAASNKPQRRAENLVFALFCISLAIIAAFELKMMQTHSVEHYGHLLRWVQIPVTFAIALLVVWVRLHFHAGSIALAICAIAARGITTFPAFLSGVNLQFLEITRLERVPLWGGGSVSTAKGIPNPWALLREPLGTRFWHHVRPDPFAPDPNTVAAFTHKPHNPVLAIDSAALYTLQAHDPHLRTQQSRIYAGSSSVSSCRPPAWS